MSGGSERGVPGGSDDGGSGEAGVPMGAGGETAATWEVAEAKRAVGEDGGENGGEEDEGADSGESGESGAAMAVEWRPVLTRATTAAARSTRREPGG